MQDEVVQGASELPTVSRMDRWHDFWLIATPKIFDWFQWAAVLGLLTFLYAKHPSAWLFGVLALGYLSLTFYFGGFFVRLSVQILWLKNKPGLTLLWEFVAIGLGFVTSMLIQHAVSAIARSTP